MSALPIDVAVGILMQPNGDVLLGQRPEGKPYAGYWEFPGGKVDAGETPEERVQRSGHPARVGIWDLQSGKPLLRLRAEAAGEFVSMGGRTVRDPVTLAAEQRQVNACQLALDVRTNLSPTE